jgi:hypothetical protein
MGERTYNTSVHTLTVLAGAAGSDPYKLAGQPNSQYEFDDGELCDSLLAELGQYYNRDFSEESTAQLEALLEQARANQATVLAATRQHSKVNNIIFVNFCFIANCHQC